MHPSRLFLAFLAAAAVSVSGCHAPQIPTPEHEQARAQQNAERDTEREQLDMIPPPAKSRFMSVHSFENWENPFLTVQASVLELHVLQADANPTSYGAGGMLRPIAARRQVLTISPDKLGEALSAIPQADWPYGRVIAIEEAHKVPRNAEPAVRRALETTVARLNDLGVVVYDPIEGSVR